MPAIRLSHRRRSSLAIAAIKAGIYGINTNSTSPRSVTFAPNVTPVTFTESDELMPPPIPEPDPSFPTSHLFPPSQLPLAIPPRRRVPPGKRRSLGYIPRPPNAFMLFRADFVRQKHVPGSIETNHGSLSKIIGNCWRALPLDEKRIWEIKAKHAKAEHKARYPEYRFRPVHNKNKDKDKKKEKPASSIEDERRCEEVAQLLLHGMKGEELAGAIRKLDEKGREKEKYMPVCSPQSLSLRQSRKHRRSSSVPLPDSRFNATGIAIPSLPFLGNGTRPESPVGNISRSARCVVGQRRASSAQPAMHHRGVPALSSCTLQRDESALPEVDTSLFEASFMNSNFSCQTTHPHFAFNQTYNDLFSTLPPHAPSHTHDLRIAPLDPILSSMIDDAMNFGPNDPLTWLPSGYHGNDNNNNNNNNNDNNNDGNSTINSSNGSSNSDNNDGDNNATSNNASHSRTSSSYSSSPASSDMSLPIIVASEARHAATGGVAWQSWPDVHLNMNADTDMGTGIDMGMGIGMGMSMDMHTHMGMDMGMGMDTHMGMDMGFGLGPDMHIAESKYTAYAHSHSQSIEDLELELDLLVPAPVGAGASVDADTDHGPGADGGFEYDAYCR